MSKIQKAVLEHAVGSVGPTNVSKFHEKKIKSLYFPQHSIIIIYFCVLYFLKEKEVGL
jgi:hypothetical protein